jgi:cytoskeletal protein RodZ
VNEDKERPLGAWLQQRREELGISLEQAEEETRIRARYLEALEAEDYESLPGPVVGRGFLRNYAVYLELDPDQAAGHYSKAVGPPQPEGISEDESNPFTTEPFRPVALHEMPGSGTGRWWLVGLAVVALIAVLAILIWRSYPLVADWLTERASAVAPTPTRQASTAALATSTRTRVPTSTATATARAAATTTENAAGTSTPTQATPTLELTITPTFTPSPSPSPSPSIYTGIFLELVFTDTSWIQVSVDGVRQFQGELEKDTYRSWYGERRIELRVGNAGAVLVTVNGQSLGALGEFGDVVDLVFEKVEDQVTQATPTREPTPIGTLTVEPTATATAQPAVVDASPTPTGTVTTPVVTATLTTTATATATITPTVTITPTATP